MKGVSDMKLLRKKRESSAEEKEKRSRRGRTSRNKGSNYERTIASIFKERYGVDLVRTPQSGGFAKKSVKADEFRGDVVSADSSKELLLHIEAKNHKSWSLPKWFEQAESDCPEGKTPVVVFHKHGTSIEYVALKLSDFLKLVPKELIFREVEKND